MLVLGIVAVMGGQRVLVSGMGSELGSLTASLLEAEPWVSSIEGIDIDPPRRRLRTSVFHRVHSHDRTKVVDLVTAFDPHVVIHVAVWEPHARAATALARELTEQFAISVLGAAAECPSLAHLVVRSATEIYGRARGSLTRPDETAPLAPTTEFGRMAVKLERAAIDVGERAGITVGALRCASVMGPHVPSPLGRLLRLPAVPYSVLSDPAFGVVRELDAAKALVAAARTGLNGPLNIVAPGAISALQAIRRGRRVPIPVVGPEWAITSQFSRIFGAPIPDHVVEILQRGRLANGDRAREVLGISPEMTTIEAIDSLYSWPSVIHVREGIQRTRVVPAVGGSAA